ncbi:MAG: HigA family addiction module antidote protein [Spirochaetaceae bacterium]|jgi:addiction module HigA family antidote|nr:HigA family addiction module antidote protein [Spirochaetaceae bacterium]
MAKASTGKVSGKTPGAVLEKYIKEFNLSVSGLAVDIGQNATTFKKILDGSKRISIEIALLLAKKFGTTADFWIDLQKKAALAEAKANVELQQRIKELKKAVKEPKGQGSAKTSAAAPKKPGPKPGKKPAADAVSTTPAKKRGRKPGKKPDSQSNDSIFSSESESD